VRLAGGEPLAIEHAVVPAEFLPELDSLGFALSRAGNAWVSPGLGHAAGEGIPATPTEAGILCVKQNSEVLRIERMTCVASGRIVEFTRSVYRGDRYEFVSDLKEI
jgi:GntR family transcriptional regulator